VAVRERYKEEGASEIDPGKLPLSPGPADRPARTFYRYGDYVADMKRKLPDNFAALETLLLSVTPL